LPLISREFDIGSAQDGLDRYANRDGVFVLVCSGSLEADGVKKLIEIV